MYFSNSKATTRVLLKKWNGVFIVSIWMAIIFLPCFIESSFGLGIQKEGEVENSTLMFTESIFQKAWEITLNDMMGGIKGQELVFERLPQVEGGTMLLGPPREEEGKSVSYPSSEKYPDNQATEIGYNIHKLLRVVLGATIGAIIGVSLICFYFHIYHDASLSQIVWVLGFSRLSEYLFLKKIKKHNAPHHRREFTR